MSVRPLLGLRSPALAPAMDCHRLNRLLMLLRLHVNGGGGGDQRYATTIRVAQRSTNHRGRYDVVSVTTATPARPSGVSTSREALTRFNPTRLTPAQRGSHLERSDRRSLLAFRAEQNVPSGGLWSSRRVRFMSRASQCGTNRNFGGAQPPCCAQPLFLPAGSPHLRTDVRTSSGAGARCPLSPARPEPATSPPGSAETARGRSRAGTETKCSLRVRGPRSCPGRVCDRGNARCRASIRGLRQASSPHHMFRASEESRDRDALSPRACAHSRRPEPSAPPQLEFHALRQLVVTTVRACSRVEASASGAPSLSTGSLPHWTKRTSGSRDPGIPARERSQQGESGRPPQLRSCNTRSPKEVEGVCGVESKVLLGHFLLGLLGSASSARILKPGSTRKRAQQTCATDPMQAGGNCGGDADAFSGLRVLARSRARGGRQLPMLPLDSDAHPERESDRDREPGRTGLCRD